MSVLPSALPELLNGIRTALALSFILLVTSELIASRKGFGYLIGLYGSGGIYDAMFATVLTVAFLGFFADRGFPAGGGKGNVVAGVARIFAARSAEAGLVRSCLGVLLRKLAGDAVVHDRAASGDLGDDRQERGGNPLYAAAAWARLRAYRRRRKFRRFLSQNVSDAIPRTYGLCHRRDCRRPVGHGDGAKRDRPMVFRAGHLGWLSNAEDSVLADLHVVVWRL